MTTTPASQHIGMTFTSHRKDNQLQVDWIVSLIEIGEVFRIRMDEDLALEAAKSLISALSEGQKP